MVAKARPKSETDFFLKLWERQNLTAPLAKGILKLGSAEEELSRVSKLRDVSIIYTVFLEITTPYRL